MFRTHHTDARAPAHTQTRSKRKHEYRCEKERARAEIPVIHVAAGKNPIGRVAMGSARKLPPIAEEAISATQVAMMFIPIFSPSAGCLEPLAAMLWSPIRAWKTPGMPACLVHAVVLFPGVSRPPLRRMSGAWPGPAGAADPRCAGNAALWPKHTATVSSTSRLAMSFLIPGAAAENCTARV